MTVLFERTAPMLFVQPDPFDGNFDGIVVDCPEQVGQFLADLNSLVDATRLRFLEVGAPEEYNQQLADEFLEVFNLLMEGYNETA